MSPFEERLKESLQRIDPPAGFAGRVIALAEGRKTLRERFLAMFPAPRIFAAGFAMVALLTVGLEYQRYRKAEQAKDRLMFAMSVAGAKLNRVQQKVHNLSESRAQTLFVGADPSNFMENQ